MRGDVSGHVEHAATLSRIPGDVVSQSGPQRVTWRGVSGHVVHAALGHHTQQSLHGHVCGTPAHRTKFCISTFTDQLTRDVT